MLKKKKPQFKNLLIGLKITWVAKSNSLRRSAKEKRAALKNIEQQFDGKLQQVKNN